MLSKQRCIAVWWSSRKPWRGCRPALTVIIFVNLRRKVHRHFTRANNTNPILIRTITGSLSRKPKICKISCTTCLSLCTWPSGRIERSMCSTPLTVNLKERNHCSTGSTGYMLPRITSDSRMWITRSRNLSCPTDSLSAQYVPEKIPKEMQKGVDHTQLKYYLIIARPLYICKGSQEAPNRIFVIIVISSRRRSPIWSNFTRTIASRNRWSRGTSSAGSLSSSTRWRKSNSNFGGTTNRCADISPNWRQTSKPTSTVF